MYKENYVLHTHMHICRYLKMCLVARTDHRGREGELKPSKLACIENSISKSSLVIQPAGHNQATATYLQDYS